MEVLSPLAKNEEEIPAGSDAADQIRMMMGLSFAIKAVHKAVRTGQQKWLHDYLRHMIKAPSLMRLVNGQLRPRSVLWELLCACISTGVGRNVRIEEPDITLDFADTRWGLSCKLLFTDDIAHQRSAVVKAAKQIELSNCDLGCVLVNVSELIRHDSYFNSETGRPHRVLNFDDAMQPSSLLKQELIAIVNPILLDGFPDRLITDHTSRTSRNKIQGIVVFAQTVASVRGVPSLITWPFYIRIRHVDDNVKRLVDCFCNSGRQVMEEYINFPDRTI